MSGKITPPPSPKQGEGERKKEGKTPHSMVTLGAINPKTPRLDR
jgi:hypothetical protein